MDARGIANAQRRLRALLDEVGALQSRATLLASVMAEGAPRRVVDLTSEETQKVFVLLREEWPKPISAERVARELGIAEAVCLDVLRQLVAGELAFERLDGANPVFIANL